MATLYKANGDIIDNIEIPEGEGRLKALQEAVGGFIEVADSNNEVALLVDEEGILKNKEPNIFFAGKLFGDVLKVEIPKEFN